MDRFLQGGKSGFANTGINAGKCGGGKVDGKIAVKPGRSVPWVEKYRPKSITDIAHQDEVVAVLKTCVDQCASNASDLPNMLFYGPPGTGKTSAALALARDLFGPEMYRQRILELNASDERGIDVVRDKIRTFAHLQASGTSSTAGRPCPKFRIIILDEADSMTPDAQSALRRVMEREAKSCKFVLICNYVSRIIKPLTSRCAKFRFKSLPTDVLLPRLESIIESEHMEVADGAKNELISLCQGDLRQAITSLQSCARLKGPLDNKSGKTNDDDGDDDDECAAIQAKDVLELSDYIPSDVIGKLLKICANEDGGKGGVAGSFERAQSFVDTDVICEGYSALQLVSQLHQAIMTSDEDQDSGSQTDNATLDRWTDGQRAVMCLALAETQHRLLSGASEYLQMMTIISELVKVESM